MGEATPHRQSCLWLRRATPTSPPDQRLQRRGYIALAHQRLAHQHRVGAGAQGPVEVVAAEQARFAHHQGARLPQGGNAIPKCAGTSLSLVPGKIYPPEKVYQTDDSRYKESVDEFRKLLASEKAKLAMVSGHVYPGLYSCMSHETAHITMLRDPIKRLISLCNYDLQAPAISWRARMIKEKPGFADLAKEHYTNTVNIDIARFLTGHDLFVAAYGHCGQETANQAITHLRTHFSAIGF